MRHAQSYSNSEVCEAIEWICGHLGTFLEKEGREVQPRPTEGEVGSSSRSGLIDQTVV